MRHNQIIMLIGCTTLKDVIGNQVEVYSEKQIFANEYSLGSAEFYAAAQAGLKPSKVFEIYNWEYNAEPKLRHDDIIYNIIRTEARGEKCRLVCERIAADAIVLTTASPWIAGGLNHPYFSLFLSEWGYPGFWSDLVYQHQEE